MYNVLLGDKARLPPGVHAAIDPGDLQSTSRWQICHRVAPDCRLTFSF